MFPKYPFIIHLSIVQRDVGSVQLLPLKGFVILFVQTKECSRQLATCFHGWAKGLPYGDEKRCPPQEVPFRHHMWLLAKEAVPLSILPLGSLLCSKIKANNGHLLSPGGDKHKESIKVAFEKSATELLVTPRTWPESAFWQPQDVIVLFFKKLLAWKETTIRKGITSQKGLKEH